MSDRGKMKYTNIPACEFEVELRAKFNQKLNNAIGMPIKTFDEHLKQARDEIEKQNRNLVESLQRQLSGRG